MLNYLISFSKNENYWDGTIHDINSKLKVKAFNLLNSEFTPCKKEIRFFVTSGGNTFVFETRGYKNTGIF